MKKPFPARPARGFSLAELMIALAIGLLVLAGLTTLFVRNTRAQGEIEKANRQVENGRFAIDMLATDLRNAGYYGEFDPTPLPVPTTLPALCDTSVAALNAGLALPVQGIDESVGDLECLPDQKTKTDVLVVRRTSTCVAGATGCDAVTTGLPYFQASLCSNSSELSGDATEHYRLDTDLSKLDRHQRDCTQAAGTGTLAVKRRYLTHIYYIANNNEAGDGIPTLKRAELDLKDGTLQLNVVALAEGIENLQVEYGLDLDSTPSITPAQMPPDGIADTFTPAPAKAKGCAADDCAAANWQAAVAVKLHLLAMNPNPSPGFIDPKTYVLGNDANGDPVKITPNKDSRKRHVFETMVLLPNPAGRRQQ